MKKTSLLNTNPHLQHDSQSGEFMVRNLASNTAVETKESVANVSARIMKLKLKRPSELQKKPA